jgi:hypothetical protein
LAEERGDESHGNFPVGAFLAQESLGESDDEGADEPMRFEVRVYDRRFSASEGRTGGHIRPRKKPKVIHQTPMMVGDEKFFSHRRRNRATVEFRVDKRRPTRDPWLKRRPSRS